MAPAGSAALLLSLVGCQTAQLDQRYFQAFDTGQFALAGERLQQRVSADLDDRDYLLSRYRLLLAALGDGQADAAEETANQLFSLLRTQGLNEDKTVASVVLFEGVRTWKGEPFEQALGFSYIAMQKAMRGEWDNARAAALASQFLLRDFSKALGGKDASAVRLAQRAATEEAKQAGQGDRFLDSGYVAAQSDFALGYVLAAAAARALDRPDEERDNLNAALRANAGLAPLVERLRGAYDTLLVIDAGRGPAKVATGPDGAIAEFAERSRSDGRGLSVRLVREGAGAESLVVPSVQDVNAMARSHRWRNLEDVRQIKSTLGDALLAGGVVVAATSRDIGTRDGKRDQSDEAAALAVGAGLAALGALLKATSVADTRHVEFLPQRVYVVPLQLRDATVRGATRVIVELEGSGRPVTLMGWNLPDGVEGARTAGLRQRVMLRYVRLPVQGGLPGDPTSSVLYAHNAWGGRVAGDELPYIFGGTCVSVPTPAIMERYHGAGRLSGLTQVDLENLYRAEGIALAVEDQRGAFRQHVLEGGTSLVAPLPATSGYSRLFALPKRRYVARSEELTRAIEEERARAEASLPDQPAAGVQQ